MSENENCDRAAALDLLKSMGVRAMLPDYFHPENGDVVPEDLVGSTIQLVGTFLERGIVEGGGLILDYTPLNSSAKRRIVLAFTDLG